MTGHQKVMTASTADGTLTVRQCTCSYTWRIDALGHVTEARREGTACPVHPAESQPSAPERGTRR